MKAEGLRTFLFHPLHHDFSRKEKREAVLTFAVLTVLSLGLWLLPFGAVNLYDRKFRKIEEDDGKPTQVFQRTYPSYVEQAKQKGGTVSVWQQVDRSKYIGNEKLKEVHGQQIEIFEHWAKQGQWSQIRSAHYDWWAFPVPRDAEGTGKAYALTQEAVAELQKDEAFQKELRRGVELVMAGWGWDVQANAPHPNGEKFDGWDVRLAKMAYSLHTFGGPENDKYRGSLRAFAEKEKIAPSWWGWKYL